MLKLVDLASRPDFDAGPLRVSPARRLVEGPGGLVSLEPIVMKVLLLLLDAKGRVVTRDDLFANAWGGAVVGDDSLNRAIARVRKLAELAHGSFEIETIPRTGYRLTGEVVGASGPADEASRKGSNRISRRAVVGSLAVAVVGLAGVGIWSVRSQDERRFSDALKRGREALEYGDGSTEPAEHLRRAVALRPDDASAQGLLAFALMANADNVNRSGTRTAVEAAEEAARTGLRLQPGEPNARLAMIQLRRSTLDLAATEDQLRAVLASAPDNIFAMRLLWSLLQSTGRSREALAMVERAIAIAPLAAGNNFPLAQLLWIVGRVAEADRIIERAMQFWPEHRFVRFARFTILAFTGRPRAALAMLENKLTRPQIYSDESVAVWRTSLAAMDQPTAANIARARAANAEVGTREPRLASQAVLTLSALGEVDAAFEIANHLLLFRPAGQATPEAPTEPRASSTAWRFTPWLFTPPAAPLRNDPRFRVLADGIGLTTYWAKRGIKPDYQRG